MNKKTLKQKISEELERLDSDKVESLLSAKLSHSEATDAVWQKEKSIAATTEGVLARTRKLRLEQGNQQALVLQMKTAQRKLERVTLDLNNTIEQLLGDQSAGELEEINNQVDAQCTGDKYYWEVLWYQSVSR